ncbi:phage adaptor protein [Paenibacillus motobuensis]
MRKITQVRDRLLRQLGSGQQQTETVCTGIDLMTGQALYILPCPVGNITDVDILWQGEWRRIPYRQFHNASIKPYYYVQSGMIGLVPTPDTDVTMGLKIFHIPVLPPLSINDMDGMTGFDPDYDMVLVYGVLREITGGFDELYQQLLNDWKAANNGYEKYSVDERW